MIEGKSEMREGHERGGKCPVDTPGFRVPAGETGHRTERERGEVREEVKETTDGQGSMPFLRGRRGMNTGVVHCVGNRCFGKEMEGNEKRKGMDVDGRWRAER